MPEKYFSFLMLSLSHLPKKKSEKKKTQPFSLFSPFMKFVLSPQVFHFSTR